MKENGVEKFQSIITKITDKRGAAAVEFAIVLPLLVVFLFGIIEFSIMFYDKAVITNASREGARAGIVFADPRPNVDEIRSVIYNYLDAQSDGTDPNRVISFGIDDLTPPLITPCVDSGDELIVDVTYTYNFLIVPDILAAFFSGGAFGAGSNIRAITKMRCE
jgi:hypothetical protein